jgi:cyclopropane fatty-acyl-phospholipid synthase-like methyltransferase
MKKKNKLSAKNADVNRLYEESVQCTEFEVSFINKIFKRYNNTKCKSLREDFCASALISTEWVLNSKENYSIAVDLDKNMIKEAKKNAKLKLSTEQQNRMKIFYGDSSKFSGGKVDCILATNFSYFVFKERVKLINYFKHAYKQLKKKGILMLDAFGGYEAHQLLEERTKHKNFTYVWDQSSFNPITHDLKCHIHFEFPDKTKIKKAFTYDWRLWTLPEIQECLEEAGFKKIDVYMQGWNDKKNEETERFYKVSKCDADPAWVAYLAARK